MVWTEWRRASLRRESRETVLRRRVLAVESLESRICLSALTAQSLLPELLPGDANQDSVFDTLDLVQVLRAGKYLTGEPTTWSEGDWHGAPGGRPGNPPAGDGVFDPLDIVAALQTGVFGASAFAALDPGGVRRDNQTSIVYDPRTGEITVDAPADRELTSINIDSAAGIFTGDPPQGIGPWESADNNIFKAAFGGSFGSHSFGNVAARLLSAEFVMSDLTVIGSLAGGGPLGPVDFIYGCSNAEKDFAGISFAGQDLTGECFVSANLSGADFHGAILTGVHFGEADLSGANFFEADLTNVNFDTAKLSDANFTDATIYRSAFARTTCRGFTAEQFYSTASFKDGNLGSVYLGDNDLTNWSFSGRNLTNARFQGANLTRTDFSDANLSNVVFDSSILADANLGGSIIDGASFDSTTGGGFTANQLHSTASFQRGTVKRVNFGNNDLTDWDFSGPILTGASFRNANLTRANLSQANLTDVDFLRASLRDADFHGAVVSGASFEREEESPLTAEQLYSTASYRDGDLRRMSFEGLDLSGWDFSGKALSDAKFGSATLTGADFRRASLTKALFGGTLATADFSESDLTNASFQAARLEEARFRQANLSNASFARAYLGNADFTGSVVYGVRFASAHDFTAEQLYSTASYSDGDLRDIDLRNLDLRGWNFEGQNLAGSSFFDAALVGVSFQGAHLVRTNFERANVSRSMFDEADLRGAVFRDADLSDNSFAGADVRGVTWPSGELAGLSLGEDFTHFVIDDDRREPIPVTEGFTVNDGSNLVLALSRTSGWSSTIEFSADVIPSLGGTLTISFSFDVELALFAGNRLQLFDWGAPLEPSNTFSRIEVPRGTSWDLSRLYTTGEIVLTGIAPLLAGDADGDYDFDQLDIVQVLRSAKYRTGRTATWNEGDWNGDAEFDERDLVAALQTGSYLQGPYAAGQVFSEDGNRFLGNGR